MKITTPGFYPNMDPVTYFSEPCPSPAFTQSGVKTLLGKTPADFADDHPAINGGMDKAKASAEMLHGDIVHQLALGKGRGYQIIEAADFRTKVAQEAKQTAIDSGFTPVLAHKYGEGRVQAELLKSRIAETLTFLGSKMGHGTRTWDYQTEVVMIWKEDDVWARGMLDVWCPDLGVILDPKITKCIYDDRLDGQISKMGWDIQSTLYRRGVASIRPELAGRVVFENILLHPENNRMRNIQIDEAQRYACEQDIEHALGIFRKCLTANAWPGFPIEASVRTMPGWKLKEVMDRALEDEEEE